MLDFLGLIFKHCESLDRETHAGIFVFYRYYYDKNIILKTAGKRYVYRFVCDLQGLLGYSPEEIHQMVDLKLEKKDDE